MGFQLERVRAFRVDLISKLEDKELMNLEQLENRHNSEMLMDLFISLPKTPCSDDGKMASIEVVGYKDGMFGLFSGDTIRRFSPDFLTLEAIAEFIDFEPAEIVDRESIIDELIKDSSNEAKENFELFSQETFRLGLKGFDDYTNKELAAEYLNRFGKKIFIE